MLRADAKAYEAAAATAAAAGDKMIATKYALFVVDRLTPLSPCVPVFMLRVFSTRAFDSVCDMKSTA